MEFKEFNNPESKDYDITSSLKFNSNATNNNPYIEKLINLIGILEDANEEDLQEEYGISMNEYLNPTADTIKKVEQKINNYTTRRQR